MTIIIDEYVKNGYIIETKKGFKINKNSPAKIVNELKKINEDYFLMYKEYLFIK